MRINGFDGKTIERVEFDGLMDNTTIYFTDGTEASFHSESDYWYRNKELDEQREQREQREEEFKQKLANTKPLTQEEIRKRREDFKQGMKEYADTMRGMLDEPSPLLQLFDKQSRQ